MATQQDFEILGAIRQSYNEAKNNHQSIPQELSGGIAGYHKAIDSVRAAGQWSAIMSILASVLFIAVSAMQASVLDETLSSDFWSAVGGTLLLFAIIIAVCCTLGSKLYTLKATPTFTLVSLIILLITNLFLLVGLLPLISAILCIIALARWSTFKSWFYDFQVPETHSRKKQRREKTSVAVSSDSEVQSANSAVTAALIIVGAVSVLIGGGVGLFIGIAINGNSRNQASYDEGYASGKRASYSSGYSEGEEYGYNDGIKKGYDGGYSDGVKCAAGVAQEIVTYGYAITDVNSCRAI